MKEYFMFEERNNNVVKIGDFPSNQRIKETINAMKNGAPYIYQAS